MMELGQNQGMLGRVPGLKQFNRMRKMAGMDMDQVMESMQGMMPGPEGMPDGGGKRFRPPRRAADRTKAKNKRKAARAARKKAKKRK